MAPCLLPANSGFSPPKWKLLRLWIDAGAPFARTYGTLNKAEEGHVTDEDRQFWSFRKLASPAVPVLRSRKSVQAPRTFLAKLAEKNLNFAPPADRETLIRRAYFDLRAPPIARSSRRLPADPARGL